MAVLHAAQRLIMQPSALMAQPNVIRRRVAFLLLPGFSLLAHASAIEPLQMANQLSGQMLYHTATLSMDSQPVRSGAQLSLLAQHALSEGTGPYRSALDLCAYAAALYLAR